MENGDKLGEDSVLCPIRQWSIFKAGPYWKPFPYTHMYARTRMYNHNDTLTRRLESFLNRYLMETTKKLSDECCFVDYSGTLRGKH